jgi:hypothetical protein
MKMTSPSVETGRSSHSNSNRIHSPHCASDEIRSNDVLCGRGKVDHGTLGWLRLLHRRGRPLHFPIRLLTAKLNSR